MHENVAFEEVFCAYDHVFRWWRGLSGRKRDDLLSGSFPVMFSYHSGKIENDEILYHDTEEIFENGRVVSFTGSLRTLYEINNLKNAWAKARSFVCSNDRLDVAQLLDFQRVLTAGTYDENRWIRGERPGSFKRGHYVVADEVGCVPEDAERLVRELLDEVEEALSFSRESTSPRNPLTISSYAHARLAEIHPFADGNGRCSRLLQNICLLRMDAPPLVFDERDRMAYYGALDAFHAEGDVEQIVSFCAAEAVKTWAREAGLEAGAHPADQVPGIG